MLHFFFFIYGYILSWGNNKYILKSYTYINMQVKS